LHIICDCSPAQFVWNNVDISTLVQGKWHLNLTEWIIENFTMDSIDGGEDCAMKFLVTVWWLLWWCDAKFFNKEDEVQSSPISFLYFVFKKLSVPHKGMILCLVTLVI